MTALDRLDAVIAAPREGGTRARANAIRAHQASVAAQSFLDELLDLRVGVAKLVERIERAKATRTAKAK